MTHRPNLISVYLNPNFCCVFFPFLFYRKEYSHFCVHFIRQSSTVQWISSFNLSTYTFVALSSHFFIYLKMPLTVWGFCGLYGRHTLFAPCQQIKKTWKKITSWLMFMYTIWHVFILQCIVLCDFGIAYWYMWGCLFHWENCCVNLING